MALPFRKPGSGGFLNNAAVTLLGITFKVNKTGKSKTGEDWKTYSGVVKIQPDGGKAVEQYLNAGFLYGNLSISKDGKTIEGSDKFFPEGTTDFGKFILSMTNEVIKEGLCVPDEMLGDLRNYEAIEGLRFVVNRIQDREATIEAGKRALAKKGQKNPTDEAALEAGKREDKEDKSKKYLLDRIEVKEVLALPEAKKTGGKKTTASAKTTKTEAAPAAAPAASASADEADTMFKAIATAATTGEFEGMSTVERSKISSLVVRQAMSQKLDPAVRESLRTTLISDEYINGAIERGFLVASQDNKVLAVAA